MTNQHHEPIKRKKYTRKIIVDASLQFSLIRWFMVVFLSAAVVFFMILNYVFLQINLYLRDQDANLFHQLEDRLQDLQTHASEIFGVLIFAFIIFVFFGGLHLSRKIAGPIQSVKNAMSRITEGQEVTHIQFRKNDYFIDLQHKFNDLIKFINSKSK
jgi:hypothetical protein